MKICFLSSMHPARDKRVFDKEARSLQRAGYEVVHLCPGEDSRQEIVENIRIITYASRSGILQRLAGLRKLFVLAKSIGADVYHCNEVDSWMVGVALKLLTRAKLVFDVHEHYPSVFAESRFPRVMRPLVSFSVRLLFRLLTPFTDYIVLAKQTVADDFKCPENRKVLVRNYASKEAFMFAPENVEKYRNITLVHLGLIGRKRGWPIILEAMRLQVHKEMRLLVVGEFNDSSEDEFRRTVVEYGLTDRVEFLQWMPYNEAFKLLCKSHIGIVAFQPGIKNHIYAMPHKLFDYMAAGLATLCPYFAVEVAPAVEEAKAGILIDPSSPAKLADTLDYLAANPDEVSKMAANGKLAVETTYNWQSEADKLIEMYRNIESTL